MDKETMFKLSYGLFVLTACENGQDNGCIINTVSQVTSTPNRICIAINKSNLTHDMIVNTGVFTVSIISENAAFDLFKHFGFVSGREVDKFQDFSACQTAQNGTKIVLDGTNGYISANVIKAVDLGTHNLFIADVTQAETLSDAPSATYAYYHANIKPNDPIQTQKTVWKCTVCGYEYVGEELPEDFIYPWCKHPASDFEKISPA